MSSKRNARAVSIGLSSDPSTAQWTYLTRRLVRCGHGNSRLPVRAFTIGSCWRFAIGLLHKAIIAVYNYWQMQIKNPLITTIREFRSNLRVLEREITTQLEGETNCCGVTLAQCHSLLELSQRPHSLTSLADVLDLDRSTLSRTVESMVKSGLCERATVAGDRRSVRLALSPLGRSKVDSINRMCDEYYGEVLGQLGDSVQRQVIRSVGILAEAMKRLRTSSKAQPSCAGKPAIAGTPDCCTGQSAESKKRPRKKGSTA